MLLGDDDGSGAYNNNNEIIIVLFSVPSDIPKLENDERTLMNIEHITHSPFLALFSIHHYHPSATIDQVVVAK